MTDPPPSPPNPEAGRPDQSAPSSGPGARQITALLSLLGDDSPTTQEAVIKALAELGSAGEAALESAAMDPEPRARTRARSALAEVRYRRGRESLQRLLRKPGSAAREERACLVPGLLAIDDMLGFRDRAAGSGEPCPAETSLDEWAAALGAEEAWKEGPTLAAAGALRSVLGDRAGLRGPERDFHNLQHVSLSRTIVQGKGLPLTLCAIYASVARANGLDASLLPFPGQVLLGLGPPGDRLILDPFHGGALVSLATCLRRLTDMGAPPSPEWLEPASDREMLVRQTRNLGAAMARHGRGRDALEFAQLAEETS